MNNIELKDQLNRINKVIPKVLRGYIILIIQSMEMWVICLFGKEQNNF